MVSVSPSSSTEARASFTLTRPKEDILLQPLTWHEHQSTLRAPLGLYAIRAQQKPLKPATSAKEAATLNTSSLHTENERSFYIKALAQFPSHLVRGGW